MILDCKYYFFNKKKPLVTEIYLLDIMLKKITCGGI
jgi:hypothetical protein